MENKQTQFTERRKNFMSLYEGDPILTKQLPEVTAQLISEEFGVNIYDTATVPIVFVTGWEHILKYVVSQPATEFAVDICGVSIEYVTEETESDKPRNIVPQLRHKRTIIPTKQPHQAVAGSSYNDELLAKYNSWRSVNLQETLDKVERDIYSAMLNEFGLNVMVSASIFPIMSMCYTAAIQIARTTRQEINMYNIFTITVTDEDVVILTPSATVKQKLKSDTEKH